MNTTTTGRRGLAALAAIGAAAFAAPALTGATGRCECDECEYDDEHHPDCQCPACGGTSQVQIVYVQVGGGKGRRRSGKRKK